MEKEHLMNNTDVQQRIETRVTNGLGFPNETNNYFYEKIKKECYRLENNPELVSPEEKGFEEDLLKFKLAMYSAKTAKTDKEWEEPAKRVQEYPAKIHRRIDHLNLLEESIFQQEISEEIARHRVGPTTPHTMTMYSMTNLGKILCTGICTPACSS